MLICSSKKSFKHRSGPKHKYGLRNMIACFVHMEIVVGTSVFQTDTQHVLRVVPTAGSPMILYRLLSCDIVHKLLLVPLPTSNYAGSKEPLFVE